MAADLPFSDRAIHFVKLIAKDGGSDSYDKWAGSYELDVNHMNYSGYKSVGQKWLSIHTDFVANFAKTGAKHKAFDAGCGTGLVGEILTNLVPHDLLEMHGGDISEKMLEVAKSKNIYTDLKIINLKETLPYEADSFDSVVCAGVFAVGHCGPECLPHVVRILKPGCYLIATVNRELYDKTEVEWKKKIKECDCELVEESEMPYRDHAKAMVIVVCKPQHKPS